MLLHFTSRAHSLLAFGHTKDASRCEVAVRESTQIRAVVFVYVVILSGPLVCHEEPYDKQMTRRGFPPSVLRTKANKLKMI